MSKDNESRGFHGDSGFSPESEDSKKVILIVEDDKLSLKMMEELFEKFGHVTIGLLNPGDEEIGETLEQQKFDLVISDGLNGYWEAVCDFAQAAGVTALVVSSSREYLGNAQAKGLKTVHRAGLEAMSLDDHNFPDWFKEIFSEETK